METKLRFLYSVGFMLLGYGTSLSESCDNDGDCSSNQWCALNPTGGKSCKSYTTLGEKCNTFTSPGNFGLCDPSIHKCYEPRYCLVSTIGGTCVDKSMLLKDGDCCINNEDCASGLCGDGQANVGTQNVCQPSLGAVEPDKDSHMKCSENNDCPDDQWCSLNLNGKKTCKDYAALGETCNAFTTPGNFEMCNPSIHKCHEPQYCLMSSIGIGGTCVDKSMLLEDGDCCSNNEDCASGLCGDGEGLGGQLCQPSVVSEEDEDTLGGQEEDILDECSKNNDCPDDQWCARHSNRYNFCKKYAALNERCNAFTLPEDFGLCDSTIHKCYQPKYCIISDLGGTCVDKSMLLGIGDCCSNDEDCASGVCGDGVGLCLPSLDGSTGTDGTIGSNLFSAAQAEEFATSNGNRNLCHQSFILTLISLVVTYVAIK